MDTNSSFSLIISISALTLLAVQEGHLACKTSAIPKSSLETGGNHSNPKQKY